METNDAAQAADLFISALCHITARHSPVIALDLSLALREAASQSQQFGHPHVSELLRVWSAVLARPTTPATATK